MIYCPSEGLTNLQWEESIALQEAMEAHFEAIDAMEALLQGEDGVGVMDVQIAQIGARLAGQRWKAIREAKRLTEAA